MTGWSICDRDGPISAGRVPLSGDHQWARLHRLLGLVREQAATAAQDLRARQGLPVLVRLVVEDAPLKYARPSAAKGATNAAAASSADRRTLRQVAKVGGAFGAHVGGDVEPLFVEPEEWRGWWTPTRGRSANRTAVKAWAMGMVSRCWPAAYSALAKAGDRGLEDVSEAIMIGVGAARRFEATGMAAPQTWTPRLADGAVWGLDWSRPEVA